MAVLGPTSRPSDDIANGRVARELPVASALPIRQDLAQNASFVVFGVMVVWAFCRAFEGSAI